MAWYVADVRPKVELLNLSAEQRDAATEITDSLRVFFAPRGAQQKHGMVFAIQSAATNSTIIVQCCSMLRSPTFSAEFAIWATPGEGIWHQGPPELPALLSLVTGPLVDHADAKGQRHVVKLWTETELSSELVRKCAGPWQFRPTKIVFPVGHPLNDILIESIATPLDVGEERCKAAEYAKAMRAVRLLKQVLRPPRPPRRGGAAGARAQRRRRLAPGQPVGKDVAGEVDGGEQEASDDEYAAFLEQPVAIFETSGLLLDEMDGAESEHTSDDDVEDAFQVFQDSSPRFVGPRFRVGGRGSAASLKQRRIGTPFAFCLRVPLGCLSHCVLRKPP